MSELWGGRNQSGRIKGADATFCSAAQWKLRTPDSGPRKPLKEHAKSERDAYLAYLYMSILEAKERVPCHVRSRSQAHCRAVAKNRTSSGQPVTKDRKSAVASISRCLESKSMGVPRPIWTSTSADGMHDVLTGPKGRLHRWGAIDRQESLLAACCCTTTSITRVEGCFCGQVREAIRAGQAIVGVVRCER